MRKAENVLLRLGALETTSSAVPTGMLTSGTTSITNMGKTMSLFPLAPRHGRMLVNAKQSGRGGNVMPFVVCLVAAGSVVDPFVAADDVKGSENNDEEEAQEGEGEEKEASRKKRKLMWGKLDVSGSFYFQVPLPIAPKRPIHRLATTPRTFSDFSRLLGHTSMLAVEDSGAKGTLFDTRWDACPLLTCCLGAHKLLQAMEEIHKLRAQLMRIVQSNFEIADEDVGFTSKLEPPNDIQASSLANIISQKHAHLLSLSSSRSYVNFSVPLP